MKQCVLIIGDYALRMPQRMRYSETFDLRAICEELRACGIRALISHYEDPYLWKILRNMHVSAAVLATSFHRGYRQLVNSVVVALDANGIDLIPGSEHVLSYENKLVQAAMMNALGIPGPKTLVVATVEGLSRAAHILGYPFVVKDAEGFSSQGVSLVRESCELEEVVAARFGERAEGTRGVGSAVVQEFIPNLTGDWKVIVIGDFAASLWRGIRVGDFRASGSGLFRFERAPEEVLDFAFRVKSALRAPWVSCDIAVSVGGPRLLEYQVVHYGTMTIDKTPEHYVRSGEGWTSVEGAVPAERAIAGAIRAYLETRR